MGLGILIPQDNSCERTGATMPLHLIAAILHRNFYLHFRISRLGQPRHPQAYPTHGEHSDRLQYDPSRLHNGLPSVRSEILASVWIGPSESGHCEAADHFSWSQSSAIRVPQSIKTMKPLFPVPAVIRQTSPPSRLGADHQEKEPNGY